MFKLKLELGLFPWEVYIPSTKSWCLDKKQFSVSQELFGMWGDSAVTLCSAFHQLMYKNSKFFKNIIYIISKSENDFCSKHIGVQRWKKSSLSPKACNLFKIITSLMSTDDNWSKAFKDLGVRRNNIRKIQEGHYYQYSMIQHMLIK